MTLPSHLLIVAAKVEPQVEGDWNRWYNKVHVPEIVDCPGFHSAARYVHERADGEREYLAVYEIDGPQALETKEFIARRGWAQLTGKVTSDRRVFRRITHAEHG